MQSHGLECKPEEVNNLRGDEARAGFINCFKEVQRFKTQLEQYTDIKADDKAKIESLLPEDTLRAFRGMYLEKARELKKKREKEEARRLADRLKTLISSSCCSHRQLSITTISWALSPDI